MQTILDDLLKGKSAASDVDHAGHLAVQNG